MKYRHQDIKFTPRQITSLNLNQNNTLNDLELFIQAVQSFIHDKQKSNKKGIKFSNGQKLSYKKAQGILCELESYFALKGCFSMGICGNCEYFGNSCSTSGIIGYCKGQEKHAFDTCNEHSVSGGGFGLEK